EVTFDVVQGETYSVVVSGANGSTGAYALTFQPSRTAPLNGVLTASGPVAFPVSLNVPPRLVNRLNVDAARAVLTPALVPLSVAQAGRLTAPLPADGFVARLSLFDADGNLLIQSNGQAPGKQDPLIVQQLRGESLGTHYYLAIQRLGAGGTGAYTLTTDLK